MRVCVLYGGEMVLYGRINVVIKGTVFESL